MERKKANTTKQKIEANAGTDSRPPGERGMQRSASKEGKRSTEATEEIRKNERPRPRSQWFG